MTDITEIENVIIELMRSVYNKTVLKTDIILRCGKKIPNVNCKEINLALMNLISTETIKKIDDVKYKLVK